MVKRLSDVSGGRQGIGGEKEGDGDDIEDAYACACARIGV